MNTSPHTHGQPDHEALLAAVLATCDEFQADAALAALFAQLGLAGPPAAGAGSGARQRALTCVGRLRGRWRAGESELLRLVRGLAARYRADRRGQALERLAGVLEPELRRSPAAQLHRTEHYMARLDTCPLGALLADYLGEPEGALAHGRVEQALAERALEAPALEAPPAWPDGLLARPAGALLAWAVGQAARQAGPPPGCLASRPALRPEQVRLFVRAWQRWPDNPALADQTLLAGLAGWLAADGWPVWPLIALLAERAPELAAGCAQGWLGAADAQALPAAEALLLHPASRAAGQTLLRRLLMGAQQAPELPRRLAALAFQHGCYPEALGALALLGSQDGHALDQQSRAWQIAALAANGQADLAAQLYTNVWLELPGAPAFPFPQLLLPALPPQTRAGLRAELLKTAELELLEPPARLEARMARGQARVTLPGWAELLRQALAPEPRREVWPALLSERPAALDLLVWLTEACLQAPPDEIYHHLAQRLWQGLLQRQGGEPGPLRLLAAAALVLLAQSDQQAALLFEQHLAQAPLAERWVQRAAQRYLAGLARLRRWEHAARFIGRPDFTRMRDLLGPAELRYWQLLRGIEQALGTDQPGLSPAGLWVQALCLPLPDPQIQALVAHFAQRRQHGAALGSPALRELAPHIARRGKALGERLLTLLSSGEERQQARALLTEVSLEDLDGLLLQLGGCRSMGDGPAGVALRHVS